ncbi:hypothetical protein PSAB6_580010 [Paraburkholderia sabiae]|nr:hypothetical protein PSAB6_580010 [Paraburkholderia sabiae]
MPNPYSTTKDKPPDVALKELTVTGYLLSVSKILDLSRHVLARSALE